MFWDLKNYFWTEICQEIFHDSTLGLIYALFAILFGVQNKGSATFP